MDMPQMDFPQDPDVEEPVIQPKKRKINPKIMLEIKVKIVIYIPLNLGNSIRR